MTKTVRAVPAPPDPDCAALLPGYQFADAFRVPVGAEVDAMQAVKRALASSTRPGWMLTLMKLRNRLVAPFGLKLALPTDFPVISESPSRVVLGLDDHHLDFRIVMVREGGDATLTTAVRWHNLGGRLYLAAVMPFHRVIAARLLESVVA